MTFALYQQRILDHAKRPRHFGLLDAPDARAEAANPLCGDTMTISLKLANGVVEDVGFAGEGCAISRAGASILAEHALGKSVEELRAMDLNDQLALMGGSINPARLKCATLGLETLQRALRPRA